MDKKLEPGINVVMNFSTDDFSKYMNPPEESSVNETEENSKVENK